jgi:hypothetical protein
MNNKQLLNNKNICFYGIKTYLFVKLNTLWFFEKSTTEHIVTIFFCCFAGTVAFKNVTKANLSPQKIQH